MITFKTTNDIKLDSPGITESAENKVPARQHLKTKNFIPNIENVRYWEEIFYRKHYLGIYAAWDPYVEYYIITYNLFLDKENFYKEFYGINAKNDVITEATKLGCVLEEKFLFVEEIDYNNFKDIVDNT